MVARGDGHLGVRVHRRCTGASGCRITVAFILALTLPLTLLLASAFVPCTAAAAHADRSAAAGARLVAAAAAGHLDPLVAFPVACGAGVSMVLLGVPWVCFWVLLGIPLAGPGSPAAPAAAAAAAPAAAAADVTAIVLPYRRYLGFPHGFCRVDEDACAVFLGAWSL